jgi:hypothetical protein
MKPTLGWSLAMAIVAWPVFVAAESSKESSAKPPPVVASEHGNQAATPPPKGSEQEGKTRNYYVERRSYGTGRETEPPRYVRRLSQTGIDAFANVDWFDFGLDYRMRFEYRDDDLRRPVDGLDLPILLRTRLYAGLREVWDPFRFYVEFEDARRQNSMFPRDDRDINEYEVIQAVAELHFDDVFGAERPLRLQGGRFAFEYVDRRLVARNEWRNTTNTFQGFRAILGQERNDWQVDLLALQPLERFLYIPDRPNTDQWFYGVIGNWRRWSHIVTLQPYLLGLEQDEGAGGVDRSIQSAALRAYGIVGDTGYDYDANLVIQFGESDGQRHRGLGFVGEIGRTFDHPWKPRLDAFFGYGSGDKRPNDDKDERFERFFGFARPWSNNDYFQWENIIAPKLRLEFQPTAPLRIDTGYSVYWLASDTDRWNNAGLRDPTGQSGSFIGHEWDIRVRYEITSRVDANVGYAYFTPGEFTRKSGKSYDSDFFYIEISINAFE